MVHWPVMLMTRHTHAQAARRTHSRWLTRAFTARREYPRIPVRSAAAGGYSRLMSRPGGPAIAERWWAQAMLRVDPIEDGEGDE